MATDDPIVTHNTTLVDIGPVSGLMFCIPGTTRKWLNDVPRASFLAVMLLYVFVVMSVLIQQLQS